MAHLIDKDALVAEIDRQKIGYNTDGKHSVEYNTIRKILDIIDTLEVKEVDLEKEVELWYGEYAGNRRFDWNGFAKHFFELGLKLKEKEEK